VNWFSSFCPQPLRTDIGERIRAAFGALIGIGLTGLVSNYWGSGGVVALLLVGPIGASAVLLFAVPASPLAQPWSIIGGNTLAALIGVAVLKFMLPPLVAASLAVGLTLAAMSFFRCVHPPSGAIALTAILGGQTVLDAGFSFVFVPVLLNSFILMLVALVYNNATGHSYPHKAHPARHSHSLEGPSVLTDADFDEVLADYGDSLDISRADIKALYFELRGRADARRRGFQSR
tara:strand:+ start:18103 stop:18801 length:699 start_codon:yes stop_codon:yes gene_type:complete